MRRKTITIFAYIIIISLCVFLAFGLYLVLNLSFKSIKQKKYNISFNLILVILCFQLGMLFMVLSLLFLDEKLYLRVFISIANSLELAMLFFLERFGRKIQDFKKEYKKEYKKILIILISIIIILLPINYWDSFSIHDTEKFSLQPYSHILILILNITFIRITNIRSKDVISKISDKNLKTTYIWIHRGFTSLYFIVPLYFINFIIYILPKSISPYHESIAVGIFLLSVLLAILSGTTSLIFMYFGLTLPKFIIHRIFKSSNPMWKEGAMSEQEEEKFREEIEKLQEFLL